MNADMIKYFYLMKKYPYLDVQHLNKFNLLDTFIYLDAVCEEALGSIKLSYDTVLNRFCVKFPFISSDTDENLEKKLDRILEYYTGELNGVSFNRAANYLFIEGISSSRNNKEDVSRILIYIVVAWHIICKRSVIDNKKLQEVLDDIDKNQIQETVNITIENLSVDWINQYVTYFKTINQSLLQEVKTNQCNEQRRLMEQISTTQSTLNMFYKQLRDLQYNCVRNDAMNEELNNIFKFFLEYIKTNNNILLLNVGRESIEVVIQEKLSQWDNNMAQIMLTNKNFLFLVKEHFLIPAIEKHNILARLVGECKEDKWLDKIAKQFIMELFIDKKIQIFTDNIFVINMLNNNITTKRHNPNYPIGMFSGYCNPHIYHHNCWSQALQVALDSLNKRDYCNALGVIQTATTQLNLNDHIVMREMMHDLALHVNEIKVLYNNNSIIMLDVLYQMIQNIKSEDEVE